MCKGYWTIHLPLTRSPSNREAIRQSSSPSSSDYSTAHNKASSQLPLQVNSMIIPWHRYPVVLLQFHDTSSSSHVIVLLRYFSIVFFTALQAWGGMVNVIFQSFTLFMSPL